MVNFSLHVLTNYHAWYIIDSQLPHMVDFGEVRKLFPNLKAEIARKAIKEKDIAKKIGLSAKTFSSRMTGRSDFTLREMMAIKKHFFPDLSLEYLFATDDEKERKMA